MKKSMCWLLLLTMLAAMVLTALPAAAEEESGLTNVALGCSYTGSAPYTLDADQYGTDNYRYKVGTELTDGVKGSSLIGSEWYAFNGASEYTITVDLGKEVTLLARISAEFCSKTDYAIALPASVRFSGSTDGSSFTELGTAQDVTEDETYSYHEFRLDLLNSASYRYIRMTVASGGFFVFCSEIEVFSGYINEFSISSDRAYIDDSYIRGISEKTSVETLAEMVNTMSGVLLLDASGTEKTTGYFATGDVVEKLLQGNDSESWYILIDGDLNGNGSVEAKDYMMLKRHVLGSYKLEGAALAAADVDLNGKVEAKDYMMVKRHVLGTYDLYAKYEPVVEVPKDGRGDVTEEFQDMDTSDQIQTLESYTMELQRTNETTYSVTCETYEGTMLLTFYRTAWGTYNLGKWQLTDQAGTHVFSAGSTDWEYVYRVASSASASWVWSGGNHANEKLRSLHLYNGKTEEEISLSVGETVTLENLKIVEETTLYWDPAGDDKVYNYDEDNQYCEAVRTYTIVGPQIRLAVDYTYLKDAYYDISYTCMFPIQKQYGLYCAFIDGDENLLSVIETFKTGKADYSGTLHGGNAAERCVIWGYDEGEAYKFDVRVLTPETSCNNFNNSLQTAFWDMNTNTNKLYFSKFPSGSSLEKVEAGSEIHTECQWTFYKD